MKKQIILATFLLGLTTPITSKTDVIKVNAGATISRNGRILVVNQTSYLIPVSSWDGINTAARILQAEIDDLKLELKKVRKHSENEIRIAKKAIRKAKKNARIKMIFSGAALLAQQIKFKLKF